MKSSVQPQLTANHHLLKALGIYFYTDVFPHSHLIAVAMNCIHQLNKYNAETGYDYIELLVRLIYFFFFSIRAAIPNSVNYNIQEQYFNLVIEWWWKSREWMTSPARHQYVPVRDSPRSLYGQEPW